MLLTSRLINHNLKKISLLLSFLFCHFAIAEGDVQDIALYPTDKVNETSAPVISWKCTDDDQVKYTLSEDSSGRTIMDEKWFPIMQANKVGRCTIRGFNTVGKRITPPLKPFPPCNPSHSCLRVITPRYGGLPVGSYTLTLALKSKEGNEKIYASKFTIVENIFSDFSNDSANWKAISGEQNWIALGGQYNIRGNSRGKEWVSIYIGDVLLDKKGSRFYSGRHYQAILSPNCSNERCYAGIVLYNSYYGSSNGVDRYDRSEVIISGDQKISIRYVTDSEPGKYWAVVDRKDISSIISDKISYTLDVYLSRPGIGGNIRAYIDKNLVYCGVNNNAIVGNAGLVFSSNEQFESLDVDEFIVQPTPFHFHTCYWDLPYVPQNK
ncbi:hypothetical protein FFB58_18715 [Enterobacter sp. MF024]|uniref:hypothetical protein n=1 Tax=Enterobacter sp. MF024 TaxID=2555644 RepID=UPI001106758C|nr:hypothetical protein [Enterobacter sp. MF024]TLU65036.1 hypothetical protein FFB58_18715 [Enterobacter sp. MF024]